MRLKELRALFIDSPLEDISHVFELTEGEEWWRDRFLLLESRGYLLRDRLRPGWVPSWKKNPSLRPEDCDDSAYNVYDQITDATRICDWSDVIIKKVSKGSDEKSIAVFLSSEQNESNHCVPIIDTFPDDADDSVEFIVMPLLRKFNSPPFYTVIEVIEFMQQTLKGICYIHEKNVAHRDCSDLNIMLDGSKLYPDGFHPIFRVMKRSGFGLAKYHNRCEVEGVKYYFTDFGISTQFSSSDTYRLVTGCKCQVDVPELSDTIPYDPFAVDIYLLGDVYRRHFIEKFENVQFLRPLVESMLQRDPCLRPNARDALEMLQGLVSTRPGYSLRWRLIDGKSGRVSRFVVYVKCIGRESILIAGGIFGERDRLTKFGVGDDSQKGRKFRHCQNRKGA